MLRSRRTWFLLVPVVLFGLAYLDRQEQGGSADWRTASRASIGLAPDPAVTPEPIVQVYAARTVRWRGYFGVHTWVAVKPRAATEYTIYEVNGWRLRRGGSSVAVGNRPADARWFGSRPDLVAERRGEGVEELIGRIERAVADYPYADVYRVWPGPNSNTFVAHLLRAVPELRADLPPTAIGKDYLGSSFVARSPSGTGVQLSAFGVLGALAGVEEGLELNVLGLTFGIDPLDLAVKLPLAGRFGWPLQRAAAQVTTDDVGGAP
jgi:hypothetical protein